MSSRTNSRRTKMVESSCAPFDHLGAPARFLNGFRGSFAWKMSSFGRTTAFGVIPFRGDDTGLQGSSVLHCPKGGGGEPQALASALPEPCGAVEVHFNPPPTAQ